MHHDEMTVFLDCYTTNVKSEWRRRGVCLYHHGHTVVIQRYLPNGVSIAGTCIDLFWYEWDYAQALIEGEVCLMLKKPTERSAAGEGPVKLAPGAWEAAYPLLAEYLSADRWEDGTPRDQGSMTLFPQDGVMKGLLKDPNTQLILWMSARNMEELFTAFETALQTGRAEWRADKGARKGGAKRPGRLS